MRGIGYLSRRVLAFNDLKSTHKRKAPHFLRANKTGCPYGDVEGAIHPFYSISSNYLRSSSSSTYDIL